VTGEDWLAVIVYSLATLGAGAIGVTMGLVIILGKEANDFRKERSRRTVANKGEVNLQTED